MGPQPPKRSWGGFGRPFVACYAGSGLDGAAVEEGDMAFAASLVDWSIGLFVNGLRENMAETDIQANMKMVLRFIRGAT